MSKQLIFDFLETITK